MSLHAACRLFPTSQLPIQPANRLDSKLASLIISWPEGQLGPQAAFMQFVFCPAQA